MEKERLSYCLKKQLWKNVFRKNNYTKNLDMQLYIMLLAFYKGKDRFFHESDILFKTPNEIHQVEPVSNWNGNVGTYFNEVWQQQLTLITDHSVNTYFNGTKPQVVLMPRDIQSGKQLIITCEEDDKELVLTYMFADGILDMKENVVQLHKRVFLLWQQLLQSDGDISFEDFTFLDEVELEFMLKRLNDTKENFDTTKVIHDFLVYHAMHSPNRIAVQFQDETLTYKELDMRANALACRLQAQGVREETIVGLVSERSLEMIVGIYGILKAGAAYLPLDMGHPKERIQYIIQDAQVSTIVEGYVTQTSIHEMLPDVTVLSIMNLSETEFENQPISFAKPNNLAYVIYTSGTTGQPKGVMIEHRSLVNLACWYAGYGKYTQETIVLQNFNYIFDGSVPDIFSCCIPGCTLEILTEEATKDPGQLLKHLPGKQITMVPSLFREMLKYAKTYHLTEALNGFEELYLAAEPITKEMLDEYQQIGGNKIEHLHNNYGPTEGTVCATTYTFKKNTENLNIPIGSPISNVQIYILNQEHICGIGMIGEICIGGAGLARGYLNKPELTQEKFVYHPELRGERIYRTGDLGCWLKDGNIEFLGRIDEQVKIKGYRIELGDIEYHLRRQLGVTDSTVVVKEIQGEPVLCGYCVSQETLDIQKIKQQLVEQLPTYMVPAFIIQLPHFPKTRTGKLDKKALPLPTQPVTQAQMKPKNQKEAVLIGVLEEMLGFNGISPLAHFIHLGGDSIKAIRLVSRLREKGYLLSVTQVMTLKVVADMAQAMQPVQDEEISQEAVVGKVPLTAIQVEFLESDVIKKNHFNQFVLLTCQQSIQIDALTKVLNRLTEHHDMLRCIYSKNANGQYIQEILPVQENRFFELLEFDFCNQSDKHVLNMKIEQACQQVQTQMEITKTPLLKAAVIRTMDKEYLLLTAHHLIIDGISWRVLLEDFNKGYLDCLQGKVIAFPPKTMSFLEWSKQVKSYSQSEKLQKEEDYWKKTEELVKESRFKREHVESSEVNRLAHIQFALSESITDQLRYHAHYAYHTEMNDLLLTALFMAIRRVTGNDVVSVCMEGHGRETLQSTNHIERTIGWFTSVYPVAMKNIGEILDTAIPMVKEHLRRVPQHGVGYGILSFLGERLLNNEKADITFNYLGEFGEEDSFGDFELIDTRDDMDENNVFGTGISMNSMIINKKFSLTLSYNTKEYNAGFVQQLLVQFQTELEEIIAHCVEISNPVYTASDFGELEWTIEEFAQVQQALEARQGIIEKIYPLTALQEGMIVTHLKKEKENSYIVQNVLQLTGDIDSVIMAQAVNLLVQQHGVLRSCFAYRNVLTPRQIRLEKVGNVFTFVDISHEIDKEELLQKRIQEDVNQTFQLDKGPLVRFTLIQLAPQSFKLLFTFHHILMDGWCADIIYQDLLDLYQRLVNGESNQQIEAELSIDLIFEQFVQYRKGQEGQADSAYWNEYLEGYDGYSMITPESSKVQTCELENDGRSSTILSTALQTKIDKLCQANDVTLSSFLETVWGVILQKYTHTTDVVFGKVVSGRNVDVPHIESGVGLFINTIPVRVQSDQNETFVELIKRIHQNSIDATLHDGYSLAQLQQQNQLVIQTLMEFENFNSGKMSGKKSPFNMYLEATREFADYPLTFLVAQQETLKLSVMYDTQLYSLDEIDRLLKRLVWCVQEVVKNPEVKLADLSLALPGEIEQITNEFNATATDYPKDMTIVELFEEQVQRLPHTCAVQSNEGMYSYQELDIFSDECANKLRQLGAMPGEIIGVWAQHNVETIVALLGILKAGCAYMPIDASIPTKRAAYMLEDTKANFVLNCRKERIPKAIANKHQIQNIYPVGRIKQSVEKKRYPSRSTDLAYVMYTSGTTGNPKGALIEQRSVTRLVKDTNYVHLNENTKILQMGSLSFDAATFEIWGALLNGGTICLTEKENFIQSVVFKQIVQQLGVNIMFVTTSLFNQMVDLDKEIFKSIKQLFVGGEAISEKHVKRYFEGSSHEDNHIVNIYGPTENTTFSTYYPIESLEVGKVIPIGKPIANSEVYILNGNTLCGIGMEGEICVSGDGLARGYLNREDINKANFISHPLDHKKKLYRTGDLGKWRSDGNIMYAGRIDEQVKIRGHRIEIKEIESQLTRLPYVEKAVVLMKEYAGEKKLVAYLCGKKTENIQNDLYSHLPEYMMPTYWVWLDEFPINQNGKVAKKELPEIKVERNETLPLPRTENEQVVYNLFCELLGLTNIGIDDSFFDLGGHSLTVARLVYGIESTLHVSVPLKEIYSSKTVRNICEKIEAYADQADEFEIGLAEKLEV